MTIETVLQQLRAHDIQIIDDVIYPDGNRSIVLGRKLPALPYGGRIAYTTIVLSPGQTEVSFEEREAVKRRLGHLLTNIFGDDPELDLLREPDEEDSESHLHAIVPSGITSANLPQSGQYIQIGKGFTKTLSPSSQSFHNTAGKALPGLPYVCTKSVRGII